MKHKKIELPKFMCEWLDEHPITIGEYPLSAITQLGRIREHNHQVSVWLNANKATQWLLIDALRYGYEPEPEPIWGIKAGNCYVCDADYWSFTKVLADSDWFDKKSAAEELVEALGFGEVVDLNKEGKTDD